MRRGLGMWIMSKMVMFIFLFSLVAALGSFYDIYRNKVVDDTAKKVTQSYAETITDALSYRSTLRTIWLDSNIWIRDQAKPYTLVLTYVEGDSESPSRLVLFMTWNDKEDINGITSYSAASAVVLPGEEHGDSPYYVSTVCLYKIDSDGITDDVDSLGGNPALLIRPSAPENRNDYILVYKSNEKLCIAEKDTTVVELEDAKDQLISECEKECGE